MKKNIRMLAALLALLTAAGTVSCGGSGSASDTTASGADTTAPETEAGYPYPDKDFGGYTFKVLNYETFVDCYMHIAMEDMTGEAVDDAVWARNRKVEDKLNFTIEEIAMPYPGWGSLNQTIEMVRTSVMADDDAYDAAYLLLPFGSGIITEGYVVDLNTLPEMNLAEKWWDTSLNNSMEIGGKLYAATSAMQLGSLDLSWVLLFNKELLTDHKLDLPYDTVRAGKWTVDEMNKYVTALTNLNGDESFAFKAGGNALYGIGGHTTAPYAMLVASDIMLLDRDDKGSLVFSGASERLFNVVEKLSALLKDGEGKIYYKNGGTDGDSYVDLFRSERAAFVSCELKSTTVLRDMEADYGILPFPKYDEAQETYVTYASENIPRLVIPNTADDVSRTGLILDALSYESYKTVLPLYYGQTISQKGLRDEDSIEMLEIINETRRSEPGMIFGITTNLVNSLTSTIQSAAGDAASVMASSKEAVEGYIEELVEAFK
ncbi:MAG: extracellular solute-binding protein [Clostridia bacterium]|nr:extracellular solute-binding protein [Clostridia bacterium]